MKFFNITGTCISDRHFMVDTSHKIEQIMTMVGRGNYFVINRPRQYGKTTTLSLLRRKLEKTEEYLPISLSFEGVGGVLFETESNFCKEFLDLLARDGNVIKQGIHHLFEEKKNEVDGFKSLSQELTKILSSIKQKIVLMIDEVDKSSDNQIFIYFLGLLRDKYLRAADGKDTTFHSVILAGLHDIKTLKMKIRPESEKKFNSPWNRATDFDINMSFSAVEIGSMLSEYVELTGHQMDIMAVSERLFYWTSGYPFLVCKLCKMIDEDFLPERENKDWTVGDVEEVASAILYETNTLFDDLCKNLENNKELYEFIKSLILGNNELTFNMHAPLIKIAYLYGIVDRNSNNKVKIHNRIFEVVISDYIVSKMESENHTFIRNTQEPYLKCDGRLDFEKVLLQFQEVIKEKYSKDEALKSEEFLEKDLRLLFLVFLKPIINGVGFSFKEVETGAEKRLDIIVVFRDEKFVVELKIWRGPEYHKKGIIRLKKYMKSESIKKGYMLIMNKNREKEFTVEKENGLVCVYI